MEILPWSSVLLGNLDGIEALSRMLKLKIPAILTCAGRSGVYLDLVPKESLDSVNSTRDLELWFFDFNHAVSAEGLKELFPGN